MGDIAVKEISVCYDLRMKHDDLKPFHTRLYKDQRLFLRRTARKKHVTVAVLLREFIDGHMALEGITHV